MSIDITGALADVVDTIKAAATAAGQTIDVTTDPTKVRLPGLLVQFTSIDLDTLIGGTVQARVLVISPDRDDPRAIEHLEDLLAVVLGADLEITDRITTAGAILPAQAQPMPALVIPVNVHQE